MNPTQIKEVLTRIGGGANKRLGQHFLIDPHALETIVAEAEIEKGERVLEIGPGLGVLTNALINAGADVSSVERDRRFMPYLQKKFPEHFELIEGDASKLEWENHFKKKEWKFVSNLPYSITSLALRKALYCAHPPSNMVVLVQREVAERAVARDQKQSLLSLMVAFASHEARIVKRVAAGAFFPPPRVESAILRIVPMTQAERKAVWGVDPEQIMAVAKKGFAHPRKKLSSNLGIKDFGDSGLDSNIRAEDLTTEDWVQVAASLS